jgi:hypothetical protein
LLGVRSAPFSSRVRTDSACPALEAETSAVSPSSFVTLILIEVLKQRITKASASLKPQADAKWINRSALELTVNALMSKPGSFKLALVIDREYVQSTAL